MADFTNSTFSRFWFFNGDLSALDREFAIKTQAYLDKIAQFIDFEKNPIKGDTIADKVKQFELKPEAENKILVACIDDLKSQYLNLM